MNKATVSLLAMAGAAALVMSAHAASATTILEMGTLDPLSSVSGSVTVSYSGTALSYKFPHVAATSVASATGALDLGFQFEIVGQSLQFTYADAVNPLNPGKVELGGSPDIYVYDVDSATTVLGPAVFNPSGPPAGFTAITNSTTLQPGTYIEYIQGSVAKGKVVDLNVGAFSGAVAVPEPATWAVMLIGFGGIGASMRMRRKHAFAA
jgi:hypothetical protein